MILLKRVPLQSSEMEICTQYHMMLIRQINDQILMRCYHVFSLFIIDMRTVKLPLN